jgi:hypothetical protein
MSSRPLFKKKKQRGHSDAALSRHTSPIGHIAHELINQLTVLNLIGTKLLGDKITSDNNRARGPKREREQEIFERSMHEATVLAEQLARCVSRSIARCHTVPDHQGKVVRLLRNVPQSDR